MNIPNPNATSETADASALIQERRAKLNALRAAGPAWPNDFHPSHRAADLHTEYAHFDKERLDACALEVALAGRIVLKRVMGKASFATVQDAAAQIQFFVTLNEVGKSAYEIFKKWDLGDIVAARGMLFRTNTGELSVRCTELRILAKALRPLPDKFHGLTDPELRARQRYVDLIMTPTARTTALTRAKAVSSIRHQLEQMRFIEVETPMLHPIPGGAAARPFATHHHALDMPMFLRIASELYLKRLIVGGFERVFEINRSFRNEGVSTRHNPEFTMLEFYAAYTDYQWIMDFTEQLIRQTAINTLGTGVIQYQDRALDLEASFRRRTIVQAICEHAPIYRDAPLNQADFLRAELEKLGVDINVTALKTAGVGALQLALFEETAEAKCWEPTYIVDYPLEVSPLARASDTQPDITERFELFIAGREIANGFSELNDPIDQAARFKKQVEQRSAGDDEAMRFDADYIRALEYGMPPTGGCGIGIDRLVMLLANCSSIRDVILFPHMRRED